MASKLKGRVRISPSGLCSIIFSHVPCGERNVRVPVSFRHLVCWHLAIAIYTCTISAQLVSLIESFPLTWQSFQTSPLPLEPEFGDCDPYSHLPSGHGRLGSKNEMSWKSSVGLRERMASCELEYGCAGSWFLTVTQPSVDPLAYEALARYSAYALDRLNKEISRYFGSNKVARCSVWEYQDRGSLHCHILLSHGSLSSDYCMEDFRQFICNVWYRILSAISLKFESKPFRSSFGTDWSLEELTALRNDGGGGVFVDCEQVEKSIVAYLSSYLSGSNHEGDGKNKNANRAKFYPISTWCQWNREATRLFNIYNEEFLLGECEPDRKKELIQVVEKVHFDLLTKIPLARGTEIKKPQNPYNIGLYFIPVNAKKSANLAKIIMDVIKRTSHIFVEKLSPMTERDYPTIREYDEPEWNLLDLHFSLKGKFRGLSKKLFLSGLKACEVREKMLQLASEQYYKIQSFKDELIARKTTHKQLELYYG